ncbi:hypothetical protein TIFTF001_011562 [Ficus carica]|uniref:Pyrrolo-quinoline quinone repeat domain-containing protein n=1 Tax=Ficus carica TaxID=3494 RepID=A0AA88D0U5_FICCA|nr:hypothetical protein TIFTF001_011562 [Ficus carica]
MASKLPVSYRPALGRVGLWIVLEMDWPPQPIHSCAPGTDTYGARQLYLLSESSLSYVYAEAGPGGVAGGGFWGAATDEKRVYTNIANSDTKNFTLKPSAKNTTAGGWVAMDAQSGKILWSIADPGNATASGPVSVANGVLFAGSTNKQGPVYAIHAETGEILWSYATGATVYGGMSVSDGCFYVGSGYAVRLGAYFPFTAGTSLYAFCINP